MEVDGIIKRLSEIRKDDVENAGLKCDQELYAKTIMRVDSTFKILSAIYGYNWSASDNDFRRDVWVMGLMDLTEEQIAIAIDMCMKKRAAVPSLPQFRMYALEGVDKTPKVGYFTRKEK